MTSGSSGEGSLSKSELSGPVDSESSLPFSMPGSTLGESNGESQFTPSPKNLTPTPHFFAFTHRVAFSDFYFIEVSVVRGNQLKSISYNNIIRSHIIFFNNVK